MYFSVFFQKLTFVYFFTFLEKQDRRCKRHMKNPSYKLQYIVHDQKSSYDFKKVIKMSIY